MELDYQSKFYWDMYQAYQKGIAPVDFRRSWFKDIQMMGELDSIIGEKQKSIKQIEDFKLQAKGLR